MSARLALLVLAIGCHRASVPAPSITSDPAAGDASVAAPKPTTSAKVVTSAWCDEDAECAYDDPCRATACVGKSDATSTSCDKSFPPPGQCLCANHACTLVRDDWTKGVAMTGCSKDAECAFEPATGSCRAGETAKWIHERGGLCTCHAGTCTPEWIDVPCKTSLDCSWIEPPRRPAPASKVPRPYPPITPCKDGEFDSICRAGRCVLAAWKC